MTTHGNFVKPVDEVRVSLSEDATMYQSSDDSGPKSSPMKATGSPRMSSVSTANDAEGREAIGARG